MGAHKRQICLQRFAWAPSARTISSCVRGDKARPEKRETRFTLRSLPISQRCGSPVSMAPRFAVAGRRRNPFHQPRNARQRTSRPTCSRFPSGKARRFQCRPTNPCVMLGDIADFHRNRYSSGRRTEARFARRNRVFSGSWHAPFARLRSRLYRCAKRRKMFALQDATRGSIAGGQGILEIPRCS